MISHIIITCIGVNQDGESDKNNYNDDKNNNNNNNNNNTDDNDDDDDDDNNKNSNLISAHLHQKDIQVIY